MKVQRVVSSCPCGGYVQPVVLFVTENYELYTEGICLDCSKKINTCVPLAALEEMCNTLNGVTHGNLQLQAPVFTDEDIKLLKEIHIGDAQ